MLIILALFSCGTTTDTDNPPAPPTDIPWTASIASGAEANLSQRDYDLRRAIIHVHTPFSHDACDGMGFIDGVFNEECLMDFRRGMCEAGIDVAFITDHPTHMAEQSYDSLYHYRDGDELETQDGLPVANWAHCDDGGRVLLVPGTEDELMPIGLKRHIADSVEENNRLYNQRDAEAMNAMHSAGATVWMAHTEGKDLDDLASLQDLGLDGIEIFNLHAMFAPDIREEDLGLDALGWITDIAPFTHPDATGEPDLFVLAVLQAQPPSLTRWDALLQRGPIGGSAGTDAHQNVLNLDLRDGERGDSYRRMLRWFSNWLLVDDDSLSAYQEAVDQNRMAVVFEILGTPSGFDFYLKDADGHLWDMGSEAPTGELTVTCPTLAKTSSTNGDPPTIEVEVFRNGESWQQGCGTWAADGPAVYRAEVRITPHHLYDFLGEDPEPWIKSYPWIYSNAIRAGY